MPQRKFFVLAPGLNYTPRRGGTEIRRRHGDTIDDLVYDAAESLCEAGALVEVGDDGQPISPDHELVDGELREVEHDEPDTTTLDQPPDEEPDLDLSTLDEQPDEEA